MRLLSGSNSTHNCRSAPNMDDDEVTERQGNSRNMLPGLPERCGGSFVAQWGQSTAQTSHRTNATKKLADFRFALESGQIADVSPGAVIRLIRATSPNSKANAGVRCRWKGTPEPRRAIGCRTTAPELSVATFLFNRLCEAAPGRSLPAVVEGACARALASATAPPIGCPRPRLSMSVRSEPEKRDRQQPAPRLQSGERDGQSARPFRAAPGPQVPRSTARS